MEKRTPSMPKQRIIFRLLEEHTNMEDGICIYDDGWSDQRVAREAKVQRVAAAYRRLNAFGPINKGSSSKSKDLEIEELRKEIKRLKNSKDYATVVVPELDYSPKRLQATVEPILKAIVGGDFDLDEDAGIRDYSSDDAVHFLQEFIDSPGKKFTLSRRNFLGRIVGDYNKKIRKLRRENETRS